jgi:hypothetical protein
MHAIESQYRRGMRDRAVRTVTIAGAATAAALAIGVALGAGGWPGEPSGCIAVNDCYCEAFTGGIVEQPVNTLSNFGFVVVGLWILWTASQDRTAGSGSRMTTEQVYPLLYGAVGVFLGVGSMYFHASMTEWGGWIDLVSMHLFITYLLLYDVIVLRERSTGWFLRAFTVANGALAVLLWVMDNGYGKFVFGTLIVATLALEYRLAAQDSPVARDRRWLWSGLGVYVFGQLIWVLSRDGAPLCDPDSLLQGHALWHLTSAATVLLLYRYLCSEQARLPAETSLS